MLSYYTINKLQDFFYRKQPFVLPDYFFIALFSTPCEPDGPGAEVTASDYARVPITRNLTNFSGTQGLGSVLVSSGTSGEIYNNVQITAGVPDSVWGTIASFAFMDAPTGGNLIEFFNFDTPRQAVNIHDPILVPPGNFKSTLTSS